MAKDLKSGDFPALQWEAEKLAEPLDQLCTYAKNQAQQSIDWYFRKRQLRRHFCRIFRLSAILLTAFAGLLPALGLNHWIDPSVESMGEFYWGDENADDAGLPDLWFP